MEKLEHCQSCFSGMTYRRRARWTVIAVAENTAGDYCSDSGITGTLL